MSPDKETIKRLESQGCTATNWERVELNDNCDITLLRNVEFEGDVKIGRLDAGINPVAGIRNAMLRNCVIGDDVRIRNVAGGIINARIGDRVLIENTCRIEYEPQHPCGIGVRVSVLDETGSREVVIYPGISAQSAAIMARAPKSVAEEVRSQTQSHIDDILSEENEAQINLIGDGTRIIDCGRLVNVIVGHDIDIIGADLLMNGRVINNALQGAGLAAVGHGVNAENFIIEDGVADCGVILRNCYVGQGCKIEKGFTAHDSLFFANCAMENGEACALFAGPYTVSMHKATLLIGCQTSFMNAGSATNQSNHMYKLGPVHWGVLERGVKTSSGSYLMLGANIGAFSLLMGQHKTHPDSTEFPFSYLFGDEKGATVVVPGIMLRSCGMMRDEKKWPARDRRHKVELRHFNDRVHFDIFNPVTVTRMLEALTIIRPMLKRQADDDRYIRYKGMKLSRASLERALKFYFIGIMKYLSTAFFRLDDSTDTDHTLNPAILTDWQFPEPPADEARREADAGDWVDLAGQIIPRSTLQKALDAKNIEEREAILDDAFKNGRTLELKWIAAKFPEEMRMTAREILRGAGEFDRLTEEDRQTYLDSLSAETAMLAL